MKLLPKGVCANIQTINGIVFRMKSHFHRQRLNEQRKQKKNMDGISLMFISVIGNPTSIWFQFQYSVSRSNGRPLNRVVLN